MFGSFTNEQKKVACDVLDTFASHAGLRMRSLIHVY